MGPVGGFLGAIFFGVGAGASLAYTIAVGIARIGLLSLAAKLTAPKIDLSQAAHDKLLTIRDPIAPQAFVYGQDMLSGPMIFANTTGDSNEHLDRLIALTGREIDSFIAYRIDDEDLDIGSGLEMETETGEVDAGKYDGVVTIDNRKGTSSQTAISQLTTSYSSLWTSAHQCRGWSLLFTRMTLKGNNTAFESGIPQNIRGVVKGCKVYDPRLDSTNGGTGDHRLADDTTWEWSDNPALILADFLRWDRVGAGEEDDRIDWPLCAAAANVCDETVAIPTSSTQKRYTCNFTFYSNQDRGQVYEIIKQSMLGRCVFSQGKWKMWAGAAQTADITLTEANLAGGIQVQASTGSDERYNRVRGKFVDPTRDYTANSYPEQRNSTYEAADGEVKYKVLDCNACNNSFEAQRAAIITLRQSRNQRVIVFEGNMSCLGIQPGTVVLIDIAELGFDDDKYLVTEWTLRKEGVGVNLTMVAEDDDAWDDPAEGDYTVRDPTGVLTPGALPEVKLSDADIHHTRTAATVTAGVQLNSNGHLEYSTPSGNYTQSGVPANEWLGTGGRDYWVRATVNSGTLSTGTEDTWQSLDTTRNWTVSQASAGTAAANITLEIAADQFGGNVLASADFDLEAEYLDAEVTLVDHTGTPNVNGECAVAFGNNGVLTMTNPTPAIGAGEWYSGPGGGTVGDGYQVRCKEILSGAWTTGTVGNWITMTGDPLWEVDGPGTSVEARFEIRKLDGDGTVLDSCVITASGA